MYLKCTKNVMKSKKMSCETMPNSPSPSKYVTFGNIFMTPPPPPHVLSELNS